MAQERTHQEIKEHMTIMMGDDFGNMFFELKNETLSITYMWLEYKELYGTKESRIDILNESAPVFFYMVERVLRENILLGITRLTDPFLINKKKNLTLNAIPDYLNDIELKDLIKAKLNSLKESTNFCRDWRNRHIAHNDYNLKTDSQAKPLEESTRKKIEQALKEIQDIIGIIYFRFLNATLMFDALRSMDGALPLLYTLEDGLAYEKDRKEKGLPFIDKSRPTRI